MVISGYRNLPESTTRSLRLRPWLAKSRCNVVKLLVGGGMLFKASVEIEILPSLLPVGTLHEGPPCRTFSNYKFQLICLINEFK